MCKSAGARACVLLCVLLCAVLLPSCYLRAQITPGPALTAQQGTLAQIPAACANGQLFFATDQTAGQNIYGCTTPGNPGVWTLQSGAGGGAPTGPAGGDLGGTYPNPSVVQVNRAAIPSDGDLLQTNGSNQIVTSGIAGANVLNSSAAAPLIFGAATTIYVCPATLVNCAYNGDGGQAAVPSDSSVFNQNCLDLGTCAALSKATPFATPAHAASVAGKSILLAPLTAQLADTSTSCYTDNETLWQPITMGGPEYNIFEIGWSGQAGAPYVLTDVYPQSYIELKGNIITPGNVVWTGATVPCAGTTSGASHLARFVGTNAVVHGIKCQYVGSGLSNDDSACFQAYAHSNLWADNVTGLGSTGITTGKYLLNDTYLSAAYLGPNINSTDMSIINIDLLSFMTTHTPAGYFTTSLTGNNLTQAAILANEQSHVTIWGPTTMTFSGTGAYPILQAAASATMNTPTPAATGTSNVTLNGANLIYLEATQGGYINNSCNSGGNVVTFTSFKQHSVANSGGMIFDNCSTQGTSADSILGTGSINYGTFGTPTGTQQGQVSKVYGVISTGTKFTTSGCSVSATTGGATAGTFTLGANTCTVIVTLNGATGLTAPTGWSCFAADQTTPLIVISKTGSNATTASFSIPATAGATDVVEFGCQGY